MLYRLKSFGVRYSLSSKPVWLSRQESNHPPINSSMTWNICLQSHGTGLPPFLKILILLPENELCILCQIADDWCCCLDKAGETSGFFDLFRAKTFQTGGEASRCQWRFQAGLRDAEEISPLVTRIEEPASRHTCWVDETRHLYSDTYCVLTFVQIIQWTSLAQMWPRWPWLLVAREKHCDRKRSQTDWNLVQLSCWRPFSLW